MSEDRAQGKGSSGNSSSAAAVPGRPPLATRGGRFKPLDWPDMTPAQVHMAESVLAGSRGSMQGPYNVLLRSPELGDLAQRFGAHTRFNSSLPLALNELAILCVARFWSCQFVWWAHRRIAAEAGLDERVILDIAAGEAPAGGQAVTSEAGAAPASPSSAATERLVVHRFCHELLQHRKVSDATHEALKQCFGERGIVDLMGTMSYYTLVCMSLNVDQYPLPEGASAELMPPA